GAIHELPLQNQYQRRKMLIPKIIGRFKMNSAKQINQLRHTPGIHVWQRNYYERMIRNEDELNKIREYIINNPLKWELDIENPQKIKIYPNITKYFEKILK
ncbi:MAG: transposase, partial [Candidatus Omnitrophica bacterium]|nr:transposase [Candidatus Omnitrophota bacterium]